MSRSSHSATYRFDEFTFEGRRSRLYRAEGTEFSLRPKVIAMLIYMLENPGRLLEREELLDTLWPSVTVSDDSLTQCVSDLRQAFGPRSPHIIRTVPRRGYVFLAAVDVSAAQQAAPRGGAPHQAPHHTSGRSEPVVLSPFSYLGLNPDGASLASVISEDLLIELATFEEFRLLAVGNEPAERFYRISGEVQPLGRFSRVSLRLTTSTGEVLWADRLNVPNDATPEILESHVSRVVVSLVRELDRETLREARLTKKQNLTVRQLYLLGRDLHQRGTEADTLEALNLLELAIERDRGFAAPYAWLSYTVQRSMTHGWGGSAPAAARERALTLAQRAIQLEPKSPVCLTRFAFALVLHSRWDEAAEAARTARRLRKHVIWDIWTTAGEVLAYSGYPDEAIEVLTEAVSQDPLCPPATRAVLGRALVLAGRVEEAISELRWCAVRIPDYSPCHHSMVVAGVESGRLDEAQAAVREIRRLQPSWTPSDPDGRWLLRHPKDEQRFLEAFRVAGLFEHFVPVPEEQRAVH